MSKKQKLIKQSLPPQPNKKTNQSQSKRELQIHREIHTGPLPAPQILLQYNQIIPGAADRIIVMAEQQAIHRQNLEKIVVKSGARDSLLGLIFGLIITGCCFAYGVYVMVVRLCFEHSFDQLVPGWASLATLISFLFGLLFIQIGLLGEYLARVYMESKGRPRYIVSETV